MEHSKKTDRRSRYSIEAIKKALFTLVEEKDLSAVTVTDLCRLADVNRGTFYRYFRDVPDLFEHIEDEFLENFRQVLSSRDMSSYYMSILLSIRDNSSLIRFILTTSGTSHIIEKLLLLQKDFLLDDLNSRCPHLERKEVEYIFEYILGGFIYFIGKWFSEGMELPIETLEKNLSRMTEALLAAYS